MSILYFCFASRSTPFSCLLRQILAAEPYMVSATRRDAFISSTDVSSQILANFLLVAFCICHPAARTYISAPYSKIQAKELTSNLSVEATPLATHACRACRMTYMNGHQLKSIHQRRYWTRTTIVLLHVVSHLRQHHRYFHYRYFHHRYFHRRRLLRRYLLRRCCCSSVQ
jgi:hypothetical protein